jgi:predicted pyridoxine 5'-phosphate oxidase superfamily flavin-nucleotide-binding protein
MSTPVRITEDMRDVIVRARLCFAATVNEDGTPNVSPKASLRAIGDELYFADIASAGTVANLRDRPAIEINVVDIFARRGWRFRGSAEVIEPGGAGYDAIADWVWASNGREFPVHHVVRIHVAQALPVRSPAYAFRWGTTEEALREEWLHKYGVKENGQ